MKIAGDMNLCQLAERMGDNATLPDASTMRDILLHSQHKDTDEIPKQEWLSLVNQARA